MLGWVHQLHCPQTASNSMVAEGTSWQQACREEGSGDAKQSCAWNQQDVISAGPAHIHVGEGANSASWLGSNKTMQKHAGCRVLRPLWEDRMHHILSRFSCLHISQKAVYFGNRFLNGGITKY